MLPPPKRLARRQVLKLALAPTALAETTWARMHPKPQLLTLKDTGQFPNSVLPALLYKSALAADDLAAAFEERFAQNAWVGSWRNGLYRVHHYHSTAHEVLGVYCGSVRVRLGGGSGPLIELNEGDVAILPAGVAHKNEGQSADFRVVGAYPSGTSADLKYGDSGERPRTDANIARVPKPTRDPLYGEGGPLGTLWSR